MIRLPEQVNTALTRLEQAGFAAYLVGGCVRDALMGRVPADYDITTAALPEETAAVFAGERRIETGLRHGTVTVLLHGSPLEITTFRVDGDYSDARHPDAVRFTPSLREDLARRDFTVNAMACSGRGGIVDPFGGSADLAARVLRCVGEPAARFREDALRILRALRFAAVLDFSIEPATAAAAFEHRALLKRVSAERVASELKKLLCGPAARRVLLDYTDILGVVLPELLPMRGFDQRNAHHVYDVLEHSAAAVENVAPTPVLRLAALLHDVGKPDCFSLDDNGTGHFYGHGARSAAMADAILERLRFDRAGRERIVTLVRCHDLRIEESERAVKRALAKLGPEAFFQLLQLKRADNLAKTPEVSDRLAHYDRLEALAKDSLSRPPCFSLRDLAVGGDELRRAGMAPGPAMGAALQALLDAVLDGAVANEKAALLDYWQTRLKK